MSEIKYENNEKKYLIKNASNSKSYLILLFAITFALGIILMFSSTSKISTIGIRETGDVDYKVYLKDNEFYQDKYLGKGMQYIATLINTINVNFEYNNNFTDVLDYAYDYDITAKILVTDKYDNSKVLYTKEETILEKKTGRGTADAFSIVEDIDIDYDTYNSYVTAYKDTYALDVDSNLIVTMNVNQTGSYNGKDVNNKSNELVITIPLTKNTIDITMNTSSLDNSFDFAIDESVISNKVTFVTGIALSVLSLLSLLVTLILTGNKNDIYKKEINKILKTYDRLIITSSQPNIDESNYKNIIRVMSIEELIDVTEISNEPIIYYEVVPNSKSYFIVLKQDTLYKLTISRAYLEKQEAKKQK